MRQSRPRRTCSPITACGPTTVPAPIVAVGWTTALGSITAPSRLPGRGSMTSAIRRSASAATFVADECPPVGTREPRAPRSDRDFKTQAVAGDNPQPELRVIHPAQVRARGGAIARLGEQDRGDLRQRFNHQHPRHQRLAGKVSLKEFLADRHVLVGNHATSRLVLRHRVDEGGGVAIAQAIQNFGDVYRHWEGV